MPVCLRSQPSCHASLKFAGYSNLLNGDILKMSNLKLSQPGVIEGCGRHSSDVEILTINLTVSHLTEFLCLHER